MKKFFGLFIIVLLVTLTGCGRNNNTLRCEVSEDGAKNVTEITFKDDRVTKMTSTMTMDDAGEDAKEFLEFMCAMMADEEDITCTVNKNGITLVVDFSNYTNDELAGEFGTDLSRAGVKAFLEDEGHTCK